MVMRIPLGLSDFRKLRREGYHYIDKSRQLGEVITWPSQVILLPRPRRFGKTLNLSLLRYFLERTPDEQKAERWSLFEGLEIASDPQLRPHFGRYPVLLLSFKDIKDPTWEGCLASTAAILADLYQEHDSLRPLLNPAEAANFVDIQMQRASPSVLMRSLHTLCRLLARRHGESVVVLLDEYDTPLHTAHQQGYYDEALSFYRTLLSVVLKDNVDLHKGVLTGVLRVAKDNIFTGLNNIDTYSLMSPHFATAFGFTQDEVAALLGQADLSQRLPEVQRWYNGYLFGGQVIYNPWSVLSFVLHRPAQPLPYWANTSGNDLVRELLQEQGATARVAWSALLRGETIERPIVENVALRELKDHPDLLWSVLVFSGYLKVLSQRLEERTVFGTLAIPNEEVKSIFETQFEDWLSQGLGGDSQRRDFLVALLAGDAEQVEDHLRRWLLRHASHFDTAQGPQPERFYHGLVLGLLVSLSADYDVRSNPEAGYGRCDVLISPRQPGRPGVVLELKVANRARKETLAQALRAAQRQLAERDYAATLRQQGAQPVHQLAVAWLGKDVQVVPAGTGAKPAATKETAPRKTRPAATKKRAAAMTKATPRKKKPTPRKGT